MFIKKVLTGLVLFISMVVFAFSIKLFNESFYDFKKLIQHSGVIGNRFKKNELVEYQKRRKKDSSFTLIIELSGDTTKYAISKNINYLEEKLQVGDSVILFTKKVPFLGGNPVTTENSLWTTYNPNEVYHLLGPGGIVLLDFQKHKENLKLPPWMILFCSFLLFGWFLFRRSGRKHPLVIENIND